MLYSASVADRGSFFYMGFFSQVSASRFFLWAMLPE